MPPLVPSCAWVGNNAIKANKGCHSILDKIAIIIVDEGEQLLAIRTEEHLLWTTYLETLLLAERLGAPEVAEIEWVQKSSRLRKTAIFPLFFCQHELTFSW